MPGKRSPEDQRSGRWAKAQGCGVGTAGFPGAWRHPGEPRTGPEAGEVRWVEPERVDDLPTSPHLARLVRQAAALL